MKSSKIKLTLEEYFEFLKQLNELFQLKPREPKKIVYTEIKL